MRLTIVDSILPPPAGLCVEDSLLEAPPPGGALVVWRHDKSIIVGRSTSLDLEVDCAAARRLGVPVYRRRSGGGAVYHDPGNLNLTLVMPGRVYPEEAYARGTRIVRRIISLLGLRAWRENEADTIVDGWKASGAAAFIGSRASIFHATLLVEADTSILRATIKPRSDLVARGLVTPAKYRPRNLSSHRPGITVERVLDTVYSVALELGWPSETVSWPRGSWARHCYRYRRLC